MVAIAFVKSPASVMAFVMPARSTLKRRPHHSGQLHLFNFGPADGSLQGVTASDVIAICALAFTVTAFWWLNARPGKLRIVGAPSSYAFASGSDLVLNLPLVFTNTRPLAAVALTLRLRVDVPGFPALVPFQAIRETVNPQPNGRTMSSAIVVQGRETRLINCEFIARPAEVLLTEPVTVTIAVEALIERRWRRPSWRPLATFPLHIPQQAVEHRAQYLTYSNEAAIGRS